MSPFKSEKQREFFRLKLVRGEITQDEFNQWELGTPKKLPKHVAKKAPIPTDGQVKNKVGVR